MSGPPWDHPDSDPLGDVLEMFRRYAAQPPPTAEDLQVEYWGAFHLMTCGKGVYHFTEEGVFVCAGCNSRLVTSKAPRRQRGPRADQVVVDEALLFEERYASKVVSSVLQLVLDDGRLWNRL